MIVETAEKEEKAFSPVTLIVTFETPGELASCWLYLLKDSKNNAFQAVRYEYLDGANEFPSDLYELWHQVDHEIEKLTETDTPDWVKKVCAKEKQAC